MRQRYPLLDIDRDAASDQAVYRFEAPHRLVTRMPSRHWCDGSACCSVRVRGGWTPAEG